AAVHANGGSVHVYRAAVHVYGTAVHAYAGAVHLHAAFIHLNHICVSPMIHDIMDAPPVPLSTHRSVQHDRAAIPAKILIVDDRDDKLVALESVLSTLNETVVLAKSGRQALREILQHEFAVILMDVF